MNNNILIGAEGIDGANFLACCLTMSDEVQFNDCNLNEKIDELKVDVREMHDCLDKTRDLLKEELKVMRAEASTQHESLSKKFNRLEDFKNKGIYISIGAAAVIGWLFGHSEIVKSLL